LLLSVSTLPSGKAMQPSTVLPFDPDSGDLPEDLPLPSQDGGEVVVLMADPATRESGWAPRVAQALAQGWSRSGRRVILMDGDAQEPVLHDLLGRDNGEGVADAVLYGVSPTRMAEPHDEGFMFASAGTVVAEPSTLLRHPRWSSVLTACRETGSTVVLYLPAGVPGADALSAQADHVVRLTTAIASSEAAGKGGTVLHPARKGEAGRAGVGQEAGGRASAPGAPAGSAPAGKESSSSPPSAAAHDPEKAPEPLRPRPVKRRASVWIILLLILLVGGILAALWLGYVQLPGAGGPDAASLWDSPARSS
jgi:hypothetical protein